RFSIPADGSIHRKQYQDLEHMVLHDVANRPDFFIKAAATLHTEALGHRDLHTGDIVAIPDRFKKGVGETEIKQVLNGFLSEKVIDSTDGRLWKELMQGAVQ